MRMGLTEAEYLSADWWVGICAAGNAAKWAEPQG